MDVQIKLTKNESNQFNSLNICNSLDSIQPHRRTIRLKRKNNNIYLTDNTNTFNTINNNISNNYIKFPNILSENYSTIAHNSKNIEEKSISILKKDNKYIDYINLNSLFKFPKRHKKNNNPIKFNYSYSIEENKNRLLFEKRIKNLKYNFPKNIHTNQIHSIKLKNDLKEKDDLFAIKNFMNMKYYEDVNKIMKKKLKSDSFFDIKDREKLIKIGQFKIFWKNVLDFCGSHLLSKKIRSKNGQINNISEDKKTKIKLKKFPSNRIYTSIYRTKMLHYKSSI
jgi:hypothetical protein